MSSKFKIGDLVVWSPNWPRSTFLSKNYGKGPFIITDVKRHTTIDKKPKCLYQWNGKSPNIFFDERSEIGQALCKIPNFDSKLLKML